jgi:hypothetical protein
MKGTFEIYKSETLIQIVDDKSWLVKIIIFSSLFADLKCNTRDDSPGQHNLL